jgi:facilitated trehalose transporter
LNQGYQKVNQNPDGASGAGTLSNSTTSTSLDTVVIDTSADNISNSPKLQKQKQRTFSPILESEDTSNPFADDIKELAIRTKQGISFGDEEEGDRFDEAEAFRKKREHFQKTKSRSEHKSILIRVSCCSAHKNRDVGYQTH